MEFVKKQFRRTLNTSGCCFICLGTGDLLPIGEEGEIHENDLQAENKLCSVRFLFRYVGIAGDNVLPGSDADNNKQQIEVNLCESCKKINSRFSSLVQQLEKIEMELSYMLEQIHSRITTSAKDSNLVQNYSKRMTSDLESLSQLAFVDKLRKELAEKCFQRRNARLPIVQLNRMSIEKEVTAIVKEEKWETFENDDDDFCNRVPSPSVFFDIHTSPLPSSTEAKLTINSELLSETNQPTLSTVVSQAEHNTNAKKQISERAFGENRRKRRNLFDNPHYSRDNETGSFNCNYCDSKYRNHGSFRKHYFSIHLQKRYKCGTCWKSYSRVNNLNHHKKICQRKGLTKKQNPNFKFVCKICENRYETQNKLNDHQRWSHQYSDRYSCDLCNKKYASLSNLKVHKDATHFGKMFSCRFCGKQCKFKSSFRRHEKCCPQKNKVKLEEDPLNC